LALEQAQLVFNGKRQSGLSSAAFYCDSVMRKGKAFESQKGDLRVFGWKILGQVADGMEAEQRSLRGDECTKTAASEADESSHSLERLVEVINCQSMEFAMQPLTGEGELVVFPGLTMGERMWWFVSFSPPAGALLTLVASQNTT
jgi:hypothetical protein